MLLILLYLKVITYSAGTNQIGILYVPAESIDIYKTRLQWRDWGTIAALTDDPTSIETIKPTSKNNDSVYMLDGRKVQSVMKKSVQIINGKKYVRR